MSIDINLFASFLSVTQDEIELGLLNEREPHLKCVAFYRNIFGYDNMKSEDEIKVLEPFIESDQQQMQRLKTLKEKVREMMKNNERVESVHEFEVGGYFNLFEAN